MFLSALFKHPSSSLHSLSHHHIDLLCTDTKVNILSFLHDTPWLPTSSQNPKSIKALYGYFRGDPSSKTYRIFRRHIVNPDDGDLLYGVETITICKREQDSGSQDFLQVAKQFDEWAKTHHKSAKVRITLYHNMGELGYNKFIDENPIGQSLFALKSVLCDVVVKYNSGYWCWDQQSKENLLTSQNLDRVVNHYQNRRTNRVFVDCDLIDMHKLELLAKCIKASNSGIKKIRTLVLDADGTDCREYAPVECSIAVEQTIVMFPTTVQKTLPYRALIGVDSIDHLVFRLTSARAYPDILIEDIDSLLRQKACTRTTCIDIVDPENVLAKSHTAVILDKILQHPPVQLVTIETQSVNIIRVIMKLSAWLDKIWIALGLRKRFKCHVVNKNKVVLVAA